MTNSSQAPQLDPALINRLITVQEKELIVRSDELDLRKQADNNTFDYAKAALEANVKDRAAEREQTKTILKYTYVFSSIVILAFFIFLGTALYFNKEQIAMEIVKAILFLASGGIGGYAYATGKNINKQ